MAESIITESAIEELARDVVSALEDAGLMRATFDTLRAVNAVEPAIRRWLDDQAIAYEGADDADDEDA